jgi:hypothetical protein
VIVLKTYVMIFRKLKKIDSKVVIEPKETKFY